MMDDNDQERAPETTPDTREDDPLTHLFHRPIQFLSLAWLITVVVLIAFVWKSYDSYRQFEDTATQSVKIQELRGRIIYLDEVLTMSARMAAATGDARWEARYRQFEPQLDQVLDDAQALVPDLRAPAQTDAANVALVEMENRAFDLLREGQVAEAQEVLFSEEYAAQKAIYAKGMLGLGRQLEEAVASALRAQEGRVVAQLIVGMMAILLLLVGWVVVRALCKKYAPPGPG